MGRRRHRQILKARHARSQRVTDFGLYSGHITQAQKNQLAKMPFEMEPEIHMLRTMVNDLWQSGRNCEEPLERLKLYNAALAAMQKLVTALRARKAHQKKTPGDLGELGDALDRIRAEMGLQGPE